jgi:predicted PurR-regulated permease PerM
MAGSTGTVERRSVRLSWTGALTIVGTIVGLIVLRRMFVAAHRPLSWAAAAIVAAVLLDPVVDRLAVLVRRGPAVVLTFLAVGAVGIGTTYLVLDEVQQAIDRLQVVAPDAAVAVEQREDRLGEVARDFHLAGRVADFVTALDDRVAGGDDVLISTAGTAPTYLVCSILTIFLMTYGPRIARSALEQDPDEARRARVANVVGPAVRHARGAIVETTGCAVLFGLGVTGVAAQLGLPAPSAVGFMAGVFALLPHVGLVVGTVPLLLLTVGFRSATAAIVLTGVVLALQAADSAFLRPFIASRTVAVGLLVPWVVALLGYSIYGLGGAAYGLAYAVTGLAILDGLQRANVHRAELAAG